MTSSYDINDLWKKMEQRNKYIADLGEDVQATADDPTKDAKDMFRSVLDFEQMVMPQSLGEKIMVTTAGSNFKVTDAIIQEIK
jgi:hypothetical protein